MSEKEKHRRWKFKDESNDMGTDRIKHCPQNEEILKDFEDAPDGGEDHRWHGKTRDSDS